MKVLFGFALVTIFAASVFAEGNNQQQQVVGQTQQQTGQGQDTQQTPHQTPTP